MRYFMFAVLVFMAIVNVGCEDSMQMTKSVVAPETEVMKPEQMENTQEPTMEQGDEPTDTEPPVVALSEEAAREKAKGIVQKAEERIQQEGVTDPTEIEQIYAEETGVSGELFQELSDLHLVGALNAPIVPAKIYIEYLRLTFQYPEKDLSTILPLFLEAVEEGKTSQ